MIKLSNVASELYTLVLQGVIMVDVFLVLWSLTNSLSLSFHFLRRSSKDY
jgi:hypothetical protein